MALADARKDGEAAARHAQRLAGAAPAAAGSRRRTWKADAQRQLDIQQVCTCFIMLQIEIQWRHTQLARHVLTACYCIAACGQLHA